MRIKLEEMKEEQKIKFVEEQKKSCMNFWKLVKYGFPMGFLFLSIILLMLDSKDSKFILMFIPCLLGCVYLSNYAKKRFKKIVEKGDELMKERVLVGYTDFFDIESEIEFEVEGEDIFSKNFKETSFQRYDEKKKVQIMYIPSIEKWYMDEV